MLYSEKVNITHNSYFIDFKCKIILESFLLLLQPDLIVFHCSNFLIIEFFWIKSNYDNYHWVSLVIFTFFLVTISHIPVGYEALSAAAVEYTDCISAEGQDLPDGFPRCDNFNLMVRF